MRLISGRQVGHVSIPAGTPVPAALAGVDIVNPALLTHGQRALFSNFLVDLDGQPWSNAEKAEFNSKGFRGFRPGEIPMVTAFVRPSDYDNDLDRGTVDYDSRWHNYSYMKVRIPGGTTLIEHNFGQQAPATDCITNTGPITLIGCNLFNVKVKPNWTLERCLTTQGWFTEQAVDNGVVEKRVYIYDHPSKVTGSEVPPNGRISRRDY